MERTSLPSVGGRCSHDCPWSTPLNCA
jgi:hypothetical protein